MTPPAYIIIAAITATAAAVIAHLALLLKSWNQTSDKYSALLRDIAETLDNRAAKAKHSACVTGAEVRLCQMETTMERVETKVDRIVTKVERKFHRIDAKIEKGFDRIGAKLDRTDAKIDRILERLSAAPPAQQE